jgi:hypothetical protein
MMQQMSIIGQAFDLARTVEVFMTHARYYYYEVMLSGHACPQCAGPLSMIGESRCSCHSCGDTFDPTVTFQRCSSCEGDLKLRVCRYQCRRCGTDVLSRFFFDGHPFDREYFRQRMAESRERKKEQRERTCVMVVESRSEVIAPLAADLESVPGLVDALDGLVGAPEMAAWLPLAKGFDLSRYQTHLETHIGPIEVYFDDLPPLDDNTRLDRIWRFIAIIFMAHARLIEITREAGAIVVMRKHETNRKGP